MRRLPILSAILLAPALGIAPAPRAGAAGPPVSIGPNAAARSDFQDRKFGLFVHWGVYSLLGKGEWVMDREALAVSEYEKLPPRFNPAAFDAEAWVKTAKAAGVRYMTVTAKHHDGFCMFDSKLTRYDVVDATPYGKDPLRALADACRKHGLSLFFYYSLLDWHHPDYFPLGRTGGRSGREAKGDWSRYVAYYQGQVRELCTNYGEIGGVWFDGAWDRPDAPWDIEATYRLIHTLQPRALVGNNHHQAPRPGEDFQVFEKDLPGANSAGFNKVPPDPSMPLETCQTMNRSWGYDASDHAYKSAEELIRTLAGAAGRNANLLLNVGPQPDGTFPKEAVDRLAEVGRWLEANGDSVYGTRGGPIPPQAWGVTTIRAEGKPFPAVYAHVFDRRAEVRLPAPWLDYPARLLGSPDVLPMEKRGGRAVVTVPQVERPGPDTVIVLSPALFEPEVPVRRIDR